MLNARNRLLVIYACGWYMMTKLSHSILLPSRFPLPWRSLFIFPPFLVKEYKSSGDGGAGDNDVLRAHRVCRSDKTTAASRTDGGQVEEERQAGRQVAAASSSSSSAAAAATAAAVGFVARSQNERGKRTQKRLSQGESGAPFRTAQLLLRLQSCAT